MQLDEANLNYGVELKNKIRVGFKRVLGYFARWVILTIILSPILFVGRHYPNLKSSAMILFAGSWFSSTGVIFYRMLKTYQESIICPRCGKPYNVGQFGNIPFARKCAHCCLKIPK
jgi:hypothetical protein